MRFRRMTVTRNGPTRDQNPALHLLSKIPSGRAAAAQPARVSGIRWSIATALFAITTTLSCALHTLEDPQAALLTCCLALVADNAMAMLQAALRSHHGRK